MSCFLERKPIIIVDRQSHHKSHDSEVKVFISVQLIAYNAGPSIRSKRVYNNGKAPKFDLEHAPMTHANA